MWNKIEVSLLTEDPLVIENVTYLLTEYQALGIEYEEIDQYLDNDLNLFGEIREEPVSKPISQSPMIRAYFDDQVDLNQIIEQIHSSYPQFKVEYQTVQEEDWQRNWMKYYQVEHLSRFIKIVPLWKDYAASPEEIVIKLDPGLAFGTGNHQTTRLSALALELVLRKGDRVLDLGTGSGILSFIAGVLGASQVWGFDLDPQAVHAAQENLKIQENQALNRLIHENKLDFKVNDLMHGFEDQVDIIVANILPHILVNMLADAEKRLAIGKYLILSGILVDKGQEIEEAMEAYAFSLSHRFVTGQWLCYIYQRIED